MVTKDYKNLSEDEKHRLAEYKKDFKLLRNGTALKNIRLTDIFWLETVCKIFYR